MAVFRIKCILAVCSTKCYRYLIHGIAFNQWRHVVCSTGTTLIIAIWRSVCVCPSDVCDTLCSSRYRPRSHEQIVVRGYFLLSIFPESWFRKPASWVEGITEADYPVFLELSPLALKLLTRTSFPYMSRRWQKIIWVPFRIPPPKILESLRRELLRVLKKGSNPHEKKSDLHQEKKNPQEEKANR